MCDERTWLGYLSGTARISDEVYRILMGPGGLHLAAPQNLRTLCERPRRDADDNFACPGLASKRRLRTAFALPVKSGGSTQKREQTTKALHQSTWDYRVLFEQAHDAILVFTPEDEVVLEVNKRACEIYGFGKSEFVGMSLEAISKDVARGKLRIAETLERGDYLNFETIQYRKNGTEMFLEINASVVNYQGVRAILSINRDVTERKRAEEALRLSEERFAKAFYCSPDPISIIRQSDSVILEINDRWESVFNYTREEVIGRTAAELDLYVNGEDRLKLKALFYEQGFLRQQEAICRSKYGEVRHISMSAEPIVINDEPCIIFLMRDITERKRAEEERAQLLRRLVTAQEEERRRIALELHDRLGQFSTALMLGLKSLEGPDFVTPAGDECVRRLKGITDQLGREMHHLAWELRPSSLDDSGLQTALRCYLEEWSAHSGLQVEFYGEGLETRRFPPTVETAVYRIVQEALTNVVKHARANHVSVTLKCLRGVLRAVVEDDGQGFDVEEVMHAQETQRRIGLIGMHERARLVGGDIEIESSPGAGTTIFVRVPFGPDEEG